MRPALAILLLTGPLAFAEPTTQPTSAPPATAPATQPTIKWDNCLKQPAAWYASDDAKRIAGNVLLWQQAIGGWNKNIEMSKFLSEEKKAEIAQEKSKNTATLDNDATTTQIRYLAKMFNATGDAQYRTAAEAGLAYVFKAQYADSGGWPQYYPLRGGYHDAITYNDNAMLKVMLLLRDLEQNHPDFKFLPDATRQQASASLQRAIDCVLNTQVVVDGKKTAWCAQHDARTLAPTKARSYELPSLSGAESVGLVRFLMGIEKPSPQVVDAIESAVAWLDAVKITGFRLVEADDDRRLVPDPDGPLLWARFYEIGTNRPIYCNRDGIIKYDYHEIQRGRRTAYAWIRPWGTDLLQKDYPAWKKRLNP